MRKTIFGGGTFIPSRSEYKRIMLTGYLSVICICVAVLYAIIDHLHSVYHSFPAYAFLFLIPIGCMILMRKENYTLAKISLMVNANLVVFYTSIHDPFETGVFMAFVPAGAGSFVILGFQDRWKSVGLAVLSLVLFIVAFYGGINVAPIVPPSEIYIAISFAVNYVLSLGITVAIIFFLVSLNETSERELMDKERSEREKNEQLQKANNELDKFVYSVSHDLRSPLSSISGLVNIGKLSSSVEEVHQCLSLIADRVKAQEFYISEIIDFYQNDRANVKAEQFNLKHLVREIMEETSFIEGSAEISFRVDVDDSFVIHSDRNRLKSVLANLVGNAIKYHAPYKNDKHIEIRSDKQNDFFQIIVEDNGKGIQEEHLSKIFDMFYRASADSKGSGLGLYIVKETVAKLGGTIMAASRYGEGTQFIISLPGKAD
jgi:signal transduction histidine kinase